MAIGAGKDRVIRRVDMARGANAIGAAMIEREERVVACGQRSRNPSRRGVAGCARGWPACRYVIGIGGACKVRLVAGVAIRWRPCEDIVDVALIASHVNMRSGKRERCVVVVEGSACPRGCGVAGLAGRRESCGSVRRILSPIPVGLMASVAVSRQCCVVVVGVAGGACNRGMRAGKRERSVVVIERRWAPGRGRMADRAIRWESRRHVIRIRRSREVRLVARIASGRR